jgi:hypothetical protein
MVLGLLLQATQLTAYGLNPAVPLFERLASDQASGYLTVSQEVESVHAFLADYPDLMSEFRPDPHPRSKPPGIVLVYWATERILTRFPSFAAWLGHWARGIRCENLWLVSLPDTALAANTLVGVLTALTSALAIWPAFALVSRRYGARPGWLAAGLVTLAPGRLLFTPHMDTVYPLAMLLALWLVDTGVHKGHLWRSALAGAIISLATFMSLVNGLTAAVTYLYLLLWREPQPPAKRTPVTAHLAVMTVGIFSVWAVYWAGYGVTPIQIYLAAAPARHDLGRSYWLWLGANLVDFAVFAGLPAFLLALPWRPSRVRCNGLLRDPLLSAYWCVLLALNLSGAIRGEAGRIWLMLSPLPALLAAAQLARASPAAIARTRPGVGAAVMVATALATAAMGLRWQVTLLEWPSAERREPIMLSPDIPNTLMAQLGPQIRMVGYQANTNNALDVTLYWQALDRPDTPYTVFLHLVDPTGAIAAQRDFMPQAGRLPTTCWQPGEYVIDQHVLDIRGLAPGDYRLQAGLYHQPSMERLGEPAQLGVITLP